MKSRQSIKGKQPPVSPEFKKMLAMLDSDKEAHSFAKAQAESDARIAYGDAYKTTERQVREHSQAHKVSEKRLQTLTDARNTTPQYIKQGFHEKDCKKRPRWIWQWRVTDAVMYPLCLIGMVSAFAIGVANVFSSIMASEQALFLEQPYLAWLLSGLLPMAGISLKTLGVSLKHPSAKKRYVISIYAATVMVMVAWTIVFAMTFSGMSGEISWDDLGESSGKSSYLVWLQLMGEILCGASLGLASDAIYSKYRPDTTIENPEFLLHQEALLAHETKHAQLSNELGHLEGQFEVLEGERASFTEVRTQEYLQSRNMLKQLQSI